MLKIKQWTSCWLCALSFSPEKGILTFWSGFIHSFSKTLWCLIVSPIWKKESAAVLNTMNSLFWGICCLEMFTLISLIRYSDDHKRFFWFLFLVSTDASCQRSQGEFPSNGTATKIVITCCYYTHHSNWLCSLKIVSFCDEKGTSWNSNPSLNKFNGLKLFLLILYFTLSQTKNLNHFGFFLSPYAIFFTSQFSCMICLFSRQ